jgi:Ankyrin repeats (3 copies)
MDNFPYFTMVQNSTNIFLSAVEAIDKGDIPALQQLITSHPRLLDERLITTDEGYFKDPYLLYFVADNPIRIPRLPANIAAVTKLLINALKSINVTSAQQQLDYTLGLVATGRIPRECGVQIALLDLLIDEGAAVGNGLGALANGNLDAARHLVQRGSVLTLAVATGLDQVGDIKRLAPTAGPEEKRTALAVAAFYGKADLIDLLLTIGADPNGYPGGDGFHHHATALHQAVSSGSLATVKLLVDAGADLTAKDKIYDGTPLGWALHMQRGEDGAVVHDYAPIIAYLEGHQ